MGGCPLVDGGSLPGLGSGLTRLDIDKTPLPLRGDGRSALAALTALRRLDAACVFPGSSDGEALVWRTSLKVGNLAWALPAHLADGAAPAGRRMHVPGGGDGEDLSYTNETPEHGVLRDVGLCGIPSGA